MQKRRGTTALDLCCCCIKTTVLQSRAVEVVNDFRLSFYLSGIELGGMQLANARPALRASGIQEER
jgi:hypothetical protein